VCGCSACMPWYTYTIIYIYIYTLLCDSTHCLFISHCQYMHVYIYVYVYI
jgi:hypothetical protein